jgi:hypothetical protein
MRKETADVIALAIWALGLVPVSLLMQWFGVVASTWGGFFTAYVILAIITLAFELFQRWVRRRLQGPEEKNGAAPTPEP